MKTVKYLLRKLFLFIVCGFTYCSVEFIWRGYTDISMLILAGICGILFIDTPNNIFSFDLDYRLQIIISTILCTIAEGICGIIVNIILNFNVWDYSNLIGTFFFGQCNIIFVFAWMVMIGLIGIPLCDFVNYYWLHIDPQPYYKINGKIFLQMKQRKGRE